MFGFALPACSSNCFLLSCMHGLKVATLNVVMQFERGDVQCETWELP